MKLDLELLVREREYLHGWIRSFLRATPFPKREIPCGLSILRHDYQASQNTLRRVILFHHTPKIKGKVAVPPIAYNAWFAFNAGNEVYCMV